MGKRIGQCLDDSHRDVGHVGQGDDPASGIWTGSNTARNTGAHTVARLRIGDYLHTGLCQQLCRLTLLFIDYGNAVPYGLS